jgi:asparagine synthase (glutamine-hydrolysing)
MCGIAGILATGVSVDAARERASAMAACLEHRGPDAGGCDAGAGWALGMRRLAVQDTTSAGSQPMRLRRLTLVLNGEIYNFAELRAELERFGYAFRSRSDTEVALAALDQWGTGALARFNGMFALALVDEQRRTALLARDRFGKKPLFVAQLPDGVHFASELKSLLRVAREQLSVCPSALASYFRFQYVPAPHTIFRQVEKLPPASWIEVDLDSGHVTEPVSFWSLPESESQSKPQAETATPREVLDAIRVAVRRRLVADVPVGAFLSGGTDSSLVVAGMRAAEADVRTFSIGFADPRFDESRYAAAVASKLGTNHTHRRLEWSDAMALIPALADSYDEPFADFSALPTLAVSRLAREHVTVALSGDGGDELFGGYLRYRVDRAARWAARTPDGLARVFEAVPGGNRLGRRVRLFGSLASGGSDRAVYRELVSVWRSHDLVRLMPGVAEAADFCMDFERSGRGPVERMMRCDARTYLIDDILQKVDRASMSVGLEARNPLLDPDVVALAFRSVARAEAGPGVKPLLRDALRLELPNELVDRPKMGFGVPVGEWLRDGLRPLVQDVVLSRGDPDYDRATAHDLVEAHLSGRRDAGPQVWSLLVYELWRDRWLR